MFKFKDKPLIKVITGIWRCGKFTLLSLFENYLINDGIKEDQIIRMNFESFEFDDLSKDKAMHGYIKERIMFSVGYTLKSISIFLL